MTHTPMKRRNRKKKKEAMRRREEEESALEPVQADVQRKRSPQTKETTDKEEGTIVSSLKDSEFIQEIRKRPPMYIQADIIRAAMEVILVAEKCSELKDMEAELLKAAQNVIACATELPTRSFPMVEAENKTIRKDMVELDMDNKTKRLNTIKTKELPGIMDEYFENSKKKREKVISFAPIAKQGEAEVSDPQVPSKVPGEGKAASMDWPSVGEKAAKKKDKKKTEKTQSKKITPEIAERSSRKARTEQSGDREERNRKLALSPSSRTSAVTITIKKGTAKSYAEVLALAKDNIHLAEIGIEKVKFRKAMTGGVILEVPEDEKREKATALAAQLTNIFDPNMIRVAAPYRTAEARLRNIDFLVNSEEIKEALAQEAGCKVEEIKVGEMHMCKNGFWSVWTRCPVEAIRKLIEAGKINIGQWRRAKIEALEPRPLQCFRCLEIGHVRKSCTSKEVREHLCYRCGVSGHRARECTAANAKCLLCEALGAPAGHRMVGPSCASLKKGTSGRPRELTDGSAAPASKKLGVEEAMEALYLEAARPPKFKKSALRRKRKHLKTHDWGYYLAKEESWD